MFSRKSLDLWITIPTIILSAIGVLVIASVGGENLFNHLLYLGIGVIVFFIAFLVDRTIIYAFTNYLYLFGLFSLILTLLIGTITRGSVRWINLGAFTVQPSEIIKPLIILFSAAYWTKVTNFNLRRLVTYLILVFPAVFLVLVQPDLGSAMVIIVGIGVIILFSGLARKKIILFCCIVALLLPIGWFSLHDYQHQRVLNFINPYRDPLGTGYNAIQARIAVGSGILLGRGIGQGTQSHLYYLPERYTDFIFASFAEEIGFVGSSLMVALYFLLFIRIIMLSQRSSQTNEKIILIGIMTMLFFQMLVNIGMNIGIMPIAGVTLPLVSYGGSSIIVTLASLGFICNIASDAQRKPIIRIG